jgi:nickel-dependent lactate racemase
VAVKNHYARKPEELVELGSTSRGTPIAVNRRVMEADKVIVTGGIVYHFLNGFGGGAKGLSIGAGGYDTIQINHKLALAKNPLDGLNPKVASGITDTNPLYEDLLEVMKAAKAHFLLNTVINHKKEIVAVVAGSPVAAHKKGCEIARSVFDVRIPQRCDMAVASAMGYPEDIDLYQTYKTFDNLSRAVKPGGVIVVFSECREGLGNTDFEHIIVNFKDNASRAEFIKDNCTIGGLMGFGETLWAEKYKIVLYSSMNPDVIKKLGILPAASPREALEKGFELAGSDPSIWIMPHASVTFPLID